MTQKIIPGVRNYWVGDIPIFFIFETNQWLFSVIIETMISLTETERQREIFRIASCEVEEGSGELMKN